jgi:uncharacterized membrane protein
MTKWFAGWFSEDGLSRRQTLSRKLACAFVWVLIGAFAVFFSALALTKHFAFQTHGFDLGNYDQAVWNTIHGRLLVCTNWPPFGESRLAYHVEPILLLIAPLYLLHDGPETLLVLQAAVVGLGAWPVAQIARRRLNSPWAGPLFAAVYLLYPALEAGPVFEFHAVTLASAFLAMALYAIEMDRWRAFVLWSMLAAACKEEMSLLVAMLGVYFALRHRRYAMGAVVVLLSVAWFLLCVQVILPYFNLGGESAHIGRYGYLGDGLPEIAMNVIRRPGLLWDTLSEPSRLAYLWRIPFPVGYLALLAPEVMLLAWPTVAINVFSMFGLMHVLDFVHYSVPVVPFVVVAAVYGAERLLTLAGRLLRNVSRGFLLLTVGGYVLFVSLFYHGVFGYTPFGGAFQWPQVTEHHRIGREVIRTIPPTAAVSAQMSINPHLSQRPRVFVFPQFEQAEYVAVDVLADRDNEFSLYPPGAGEEAPPRYYNPALPQDEYLRLVRGLLDDPAWGVVEGWDGFLVFERGAPHSQVPEAFDSAFAGDAGDPSTLARVVFGDSVWLVGLELEPGPGTAYYLHTYWQGAWMDGDRPHVYLVLVDRSAGSGQVVAGQELVASAFGSDGLWASGQAIHDEEFVFFPSDPDAYSLGLVVGTPRAMEAVAERLPIVVERGAGIARVGKGGRVLLLSARGWGEAAR